MTTGRGRPDFEQGLAAALAAGGARAAQLICELCVESLPVTGAAITAMVSPDRQNTMWATDEVAARIDELQFRLAEGPCVEAFTSAAPVLVPDIAEGVHEKWPVFAAAAVRETVARGMYVLPLLGGPISIGVLDFYRDQPWRSDRTTWLARYEHRAPRSGPCWTSPAGDTGPDRSPRRRGARWRRRRGRRGLAGRRAAGAPGGLPGHRMVIAQLELSPDDALATLRAHAFVHDRPIDEVARDVVARTLRFAKEK